MGENAEKYITFSVLIKKQLDNGKTITYKWKVIDSFRFMLSKLLDLVGNLSEIYSKDWKERKKIKSVCDFIGLRNNKLHHKCNKCGKRWLTPISGLNKKFPSIYQFCNGDIYKFILLLRKGVDPYEYKDSLERFNETLPDKKTFYSELHLEHITDEDYTHAQKVCKEFEIKNLEDHDLYLQSDTLLFADVYENFRNK